MISYEEFMNMDPEEAVKAIRNIDDRVGLHDSLVGGMRDLHDDESMDPKEKIPKMLEGLSHCLSVLGKQIGMDLGDDLDLEEMMKDGTMGKLLGNLDDVANDRAAIQEEIDHELDKLARSHIKTVLDNPDKDEGDLAIDLVVNEVYFLQDLNNKLESHGLESEFSDAEENEKLKIRLVQTVRGAVSEDPDITISEILPMLDKAHKEFRNEQ